MDENNLFNLPIPEECIAGGFITVRYGDEVRELEYDLVGGFPKHGLRIYLVTFPGGERDFVPAFEYPEARENADGKKLFDLWKERNADFYDLGDLTQH